ncbi:hypothetical protein TRFO_31601 [Tritrichomonas foetus]|uniref:TBCC domain-containing protein 1 n=1 Tax=Tritrichomonas foetus TaxID=1144522 RepID=A0A1J4JQW8_9EUKA|nr:hypothetical protein TRFO_31601 [Tritrichomonas foetus]|eukprot:OHT01513.1 hypothetical protein TRFO_31601 [Tritrichomonas foetus]
MLAEEEPGVVGYAITGKDSTSVCVRNTDETALEISNCTKSFIYIMKPMQTIIVKHCADTTIFILQSNLLTVDFCENLRITVYANNIQVSKSHDLNLYLYVTNQPIITEGSFKVQLAPYNAVVKGVSPEGPNYWNRPLLQAGASSSLLDPSEFFPFVIPFGEEPNGIVAKLPLSYKKALAWREKVAEERRQLVLAFCKKVPDFADSLQKQISEQFQKYLSESKSGEQLQQLRSVEYV